MRETFPQETRKLLLVLENIEKLVGVNDRRNLLPLLMQVQTWKPPIPTASIRVLIPPRIGFWKRNVLRNIASCARNMGAHWHHTTPVSVPSTRKTECWNCFGLQSPQVLVSIRTRKRSRMEMPLHRYWTVFCRNLTRPWRRYRNRLLARRSATRIAIVILIPNRKSGWVVWGN